MGKITLDVSKLAENTAQDIIDAIWDGINDASGRMTEQQGISDEVTDAAQHKIEAEDAIWTGELLSSFETDYNRLNDRLVITVENTSDHAAPINFGAEYEERGPPVAALIPWVAAHMAEFSIPDSDKEDLPDPSTVHGEELEVDGGANVTIPETLDSLIIERAFWVQRQIKRHGIDAVEFMEAGQEMAEQAGPDIVGKYISRSLDTL